MRTSSPWPSVTSLPDMPLFLEPDGYVPVPLELTYQTAFNVLPCGGEMCSNRPPREAETEMPETPP